MLFLNGNVIFKGLFIRSDFSLRLSFWCMRMFVHVTILVYDWLVNVVKRLAYSLLSFNHTFYNDNHKGKVHRANDP